MTASATVDRDGRRPGLPSLTGMRFLAAAAVFFSHAFFQFIPSSWGSSEGVAFLWSKAGSTGVSFFFVLSGFVLTWSVRPGQGPRAFWRRRACKIYPNHLVTAAAAVVLALSQSRTMTGHQLLPNLLLAHTWLPRFDVLTGVNAVSWSLGCEAFFYLSFPLLLAVLRRVPGRRLWWCAGGLATAVWCVPLASEVFLSGGTVLSPRMPYSVTQMWFVYFFPLTRCLEFALGMVLARLVAEGRFPRVPLVPAGALVLGAYAGALHAPGQYGTVAVTVVPLALLIVAGAGADVGGRPSAMRGTAMVWLGEVSFALYMVHELLIDQVARALGIGPADDLSGWQAAGLSLPVLGAAVGVAWLLYAGVERPVMRRWSRPRGKLVLEVGEFS
ncbi:acyltransferase family protein [Streptomyces albireticuli]|nr:acyltransferase [Streptomyces albireticuli]MCD9140888.1 acyltransferase [Streptomyces albireticuli]MCD9161150.1 acyltransferase [Streptomyces albireticuli]MCD9190792.1 acyltransferase [Streptomyces albireticuli]